MKNPGSATRLNSKKPGLLKTLGQQKVLHLMVLPAVLYMLFIQYLPMTGLIIAFKDFRFNKGIWGSPWADMNGMQNFYDFFTDADLGQVILNTLGISFLKIVGLTVVPIVFALMLNEVRWTPFKRTVQSISYFPYFISWAILSLMVTTWLSPTMGFFNKIMMALGLLSDPSYLALGDPSQFWLLSAVVEVWKSSGYCAIIYLAAIAGIDQEMYEAAEIDGAGRFRRMLAITLPSIRGLIMVLLILNIGGMLSGGLTASNFQSSYLLNNPMNQGASDILDTFSLRLGIGMGRYSYATAISLIQCVVSIVLLYGANRVSRWVTKESFF